MTDDKPAASAVCPDCGRQYCDDDRTTPMRDRCNRTLPTYHGAGERECAAFTIAKLRAEVESLKEKAFDLQDERDKLAIQLTASAILKREELDEELQQIDDAVEAAGGTREQGGVDFIQNLSAEVEALRARVAENHAAWESGYAHGYDDREKMDHDRADVIKTVNPFAPSDPETPATKEDE